VFDAPIRSGIAILLMSGTLAEGAVIFSDVDDFIVPWSGGGNTVIIPVDIDSNGADDFYFRSTATQVDVIPFGNNTVYSTAAIPPDQGGLTTALSPGQLIGENIHPFEWLALEVNPSRDVGSTLLHCVGVGGQLGCLGEFRAVEAYIGLQFEAADGTHFGWLRFDSTTAFGFPGGTVRDWAYEVEVGGPIRAGAIPEPSVTGLLVVGGFIVFVLRRKCQHRVLQ
jgi:hypothetical protein